MFGVLCLELCLAEDLYHFLQTAILDGPTKNLSKNATKLQHFELKTSKNDF